MADPTIQTFCCHRPNTTDSPVNFLMEFHSDLYNTVCVASSLLGIAGAIYQVWYLYFRLSRDLSTKRAHGGTLTTRV